MTRAGGTRTGWLWCGALALFVIVAPTRAAAHTVDPSVATVLDGVEPALDGLEVSVATSVTAQLLVVNRTDEVLEVLADTGEPFLRIGPAGVEANLASPSWYLTNQPFGADRAPDGASPEADPRWARVATDPAWGWFDHRLHPQDIGPSLGERRVARFEVPMRLGDRAVTVRGHLEARTSLPTFAARLRAPIRAGSGLLAQVVDGRAPGIFLRHDGEGVVVVAGADGEPFLRLGPFGAEVNRRSPTWVFSAQASGADLGDATADPAAPPDWEAVSTSPSFAWIDPRALVREVGAEPVVLDWSIPVTLGDGTVVEIEGRSTAELTPIRGSSDQPGAEDDDRPAWLVPTVLAAALLTVASVAALVRRPSLPSSPTQPSSPTPRS
ncbi:MAG: hypothetical protein ACRDYW_10760 [Acidimicrobiales bacterium]